MPITTPSLTTSATTSATTLATALATASAQAIINGASAKPAPSTNDYFTAQGCQTLSELMLKWSGVTIDPSKQYLIQSRLRGLQQTEKANTLQELLCEAKALSGKELRNQIIDLMTTHETLFFRDGHPFETLVNEILPSMFAKRSAGGQVRMHCVACSSGQEPYSIAIRMHEALSADLLKRIDLSASDVSPGTIEIAKKAEFMDHELRRGLSVSQRKRFFEVLRDPSSAADSRLVAEIRNSIRFSVMNLVESTQWNTMRGRLDVIFCRNVLIYFDDDTRRQVLKNLHTVLAPGGCLMLGSSEMLRDDQGLFQTKSIGKTAVQEKVG